MKWLRQLRSWRRNRQLRKMGDIQPLVTEKSNLILLANQQSQSGELLNATASFISAANLELSLANEYLRVKLIDDALISLNSAQSCMTTAAKTYEQWSKANGV